MPLQTASSINENNSSVKPPALPANYDELVALRYRHRQGEDAAAALAQGERDILEAARQQLGWPSILSLAYKWYPLYPYRQCWKRALARCQERKFHSVTLNLKYLLLAVITQVQFTLQKAYSGRESLNRLTHHLKGTIERGSNRLTQTSEVIGNRFSPPDPDKYIKGAYGHMVKR